MNFKDLKFNTVEEIDSYLDNLFSVFTHGFMKCNWGDKAPRYAKGTPHADLERRCVSYSAAKNNPTWPGFSSLIKRGYMLVDFDNLREGEIALDIVKSLDIQTVVIKTTKGYHFYFKDNGIPYSNWTNELTSVGFSVDYRHAKPDGDSCAITWGNCKKDGVLREVLWVPDDINNLDVMPIWTEPVFRNKTRAPKDGSKLVCPFTTDMKEGDGRNSKLQSWIGTLANCDRSTEEIKYIINIINNYIFAESLDDFELESLLNESKINTYVENHEIEKAQSLHKPLKYKVVNPDTPFLTASPVSNRLRWDLKALVSEFFGRNKFVKYSGRFFYYDTNKNHYVEVKNIKETVLTLGFRFCKEIGQSRSAIDTICNSFYDESLVGAVDTMPWNFIMFKNCIIEIDPYTYQIKTHDFSDKYFILSEINAEYKLGLSNKRVDAFFESLMMSNEDDIKLLYEIIGSCMLPKTFGKLFFLTGIGNNGKSTYLQIIFNLLKTRFGDRACNKTPKDLTERFGRDSVADKTAIMNADIEGSWVESAVLKCIATGDEISIEQKGRDSFTTIPVATCVWGCNNRPSFTDGSNGMKRRVICKKFRNDYTGKEDLTLTSFLATDEVLSYIAVNALNAVIGVLKKGGYTISALTKMDTGLMQESMDNDVALFFEANGITKFTLISMDANAAYNQVRSFQEFLKNNYKDPKNAQKMIKRYAEENFDLLSKRAQTRVIDGTTRYNTYTYSMPNIGVNLNTYVDPYLELRKEITVNAAEKDVEPEPSEISSVEPEALSSDYDPFSEDIPDELNFNDIDEYLDECAAREDIDDGLVGYNDGFADGVI